MIEVREYPATPGNVDHIDKLGFVCYRAREYNGKILHGFLANGNLINGKQLAVSHQDFNDALNVAVREFERLIK